MTEPDRKSLHCLLTTTRWSFNTCQSHIT